MTTNKNIYDIYKGIAAKKKACFDKRSAAFITDGDMSQIVYHKRTEKDINAALTFNYKEGPDENIIYTLLSDDLKKGDYFVFRSTDYIVFEEEKIMDVNVQYRKSRALECNITFTYNNKVYAGYFKSSLRGSEDPDFKGKQTLLPNESPLLILPSTQKIKLQEDFLIEGKPFKVVELDDITNRGIAYYYLERGIVKELGIVDAEEEVVLPPEEIIEQEEEIYVEPEPVEEGAPLEELKEIEVVLKAMMEYTFKTENAIFSSTPAVNIISRSRNEIKIKVPFGISSVSITTRDAGHDVQKNYKVVI